MKSRMAISLVGVAVLVATSAFGVRWVQAADKVKETKQLTMVADIKGTFTGLQGKQSGIQVQLLRRENQQLNPVVTVTAKSNGDFLFPDVKPGEYVVSPDLTSLPDDVGLYQRVEFVQVHQQPLMVNFRIGRITKLQITGTPELQVRESDTLYVETAAYDVDGQYLFAKSELTEQGGVHMGQRQANGASVQGFSAGRSVVLTARNGLANASVKVKTVGK